MSTVFDIIFTGACSTLHWTGTHQSAVLCCTLNRSTYQNSESMSLITESNSMRRRFLVVPSSDTYSNGELSIVGTNPESPLLYISGRNSFSQRGRYASHLFNTYHKYLDETADMTATHHVISLYALSLPSERS